MLCTFSLVTFDDSQKKGNGNNCEYDLTFQKQNPGKPVFWKLTALLTNEVSIWILKLSRLCFVFDTNFPS